MPIPVTFPDWVPWWAQLLIIVVVILLALAFALMPFSVFGTKSRLEAVEARLDEIQGEIRSLALRLPDPGRRNAGYDEPIPRAPEPDRPIRARPPIPPAAWQAEPVRERAEPRLGRSEPRL